MKAPVCGGNRSGRVGVEVAGTMWILAFVVAVLVSASLGGAGVAAETVRTGEPVPLAGAALKGASNLHLLVASNPPFVLDVDMARVSPIRAPAVMTKGV